MIAPQTPPAQPPALRDLGQGHSRMRRIVGDLVLVWEGGGVDVAIRSQMCLASGRRLFVSWADW